MTKTILAAASLAMAVTISGCGGSGSGSAPATPTTAVTGKAADGYLAGATVFMDRNGNYRLDTGEPSTVTDGQGGFTLEMPRSDVGRYPLMVMAVRGVTTDLDAPGERVASSYMMSFPAAAVTTTAPCFVSPISTLMREKMAARPGMTLAQAMAELRNQMNIPSGVDMMGDYVRLGSGTSTDSNRAYYDKMHAAAGAMAQLMGGESGRVMGMAGSTATVDIDRYRTMMGSLNLQLAGMMGMPAAGRDRELMLERMAGNVESAVSAVAPMMSGTSFRNMTSFFPPMMDTRFWNMTGHYVGGMMGNGMRNSGMMWN